MRQGKQSEGKQSEGSVTRSLASLETREPDQGLESDELSESDGLSDIDENVDFGDGADGILGADQCEQSSSLEGSFALRLLQNGTPVEGTREAFVCCSMEDHDVNRRAAMQEWLDEKDDDGSECSRTDEIDDFMVRSLPEAFATAAVHGRGHPFPTESDDSSSLVALWRRFPEAEITDDLDTSCTSEDRISPSLDDTNDTDSSGTNMSLAASRAGSIARSLRSVRWGLLDGEQSKPPVIRQPPRDHA